MIMVLILKCYNNQDIGENKRVQCHSLKDLETKGICVDLV